MRVNIIKFFYIFSNMDDIIEPNDTFNFSNISLAHPVGIQGGAYFTKIEFNKKPLYIQTTKGLTKQGIVKSGKKYYTDLMFDNSSTILIDWFLNLEEKCKKLIYEKKDDWFQGSLEENDIENAFNPLLRIYKSGKFNLLRANIKNTKDDSPAVKIYNENEVSLEMNDITNETEMISILEIQGIKFTSRNFQIEVELKQVMVINNEPIFENCLIKKHTKSNELKPLEELNNLNIDKNDSNLEESDEMHNENIINSVQENNPTHSESKTEDVQNNIDSLEEFDPIQLLEPEEDKKENTSLDIVFENLSDNEEDNNESLKEVTDINLDKNEDTLVLKKPNQVYFELYKEARNKAKQAKKNAILAYLEAKNIKKTYMIENINDSDSDFDAEIDEASESELEGL